jgi:predicted nucleotidyltransferase
MITDSDIKALKTYFENRRDIAFAFLFGSQARGTATKISDIDIAVYFYPEKRHPIEYEEEVFYKGEDKIWDDDFLNKTRKYLEKKITEDKEKT